MTEAPKESSSLFDVRAFRHQIMTETDRLGIMRPVDDYTLLQKLKAMQRAGTLTRAVVDGHIATFAQYAYHTDRSWKEVLHSRTDLSPLTELLMRDPSKPLTPEECTHVARILAQSSQMRPKREVIPAAPTVTQSRSEPKRADDTVLREHVIERGTDSPASDDRQNVTPLSAAVESVPPTILDRATMTIIRSALSIVHEEYKRAATYFAHRGAQTRSSNYGGSRSHTYMQMLKSAQTLEELRRARNQFQKRHLKPESAHDEYGGLLRIAGRRLAWVPYVGGYLERKVREDDKAMAGADFVYPEDITRHYARDDGSVVKSTDKQE